MRPFSLSSTHTLAHPLGARDQVVEGLLYATTEPLRCDNHTFALLDATLNITLLGDNASRLQMM
jgi:hypothetical protein